MGDFLNPGVSLKCFNDIGNEIRIEEGDLVYTSGIDRSKIPGDQLVGRVASVEAGGGAVDQTVLVEPSADLASRFVKVVLREIPE